MDVYEQAYRVIAAHPQGITFADMTRVLVEMGYREKEGYKSESFLATMENKGFLLAEDVVDGIELLFVLD